MKLLEERIRKDGTVKAGNVLKVDSFLNHQMDIDLFNEMGKEWARLFADRKITKILTVEASGIGIACVAAQHFMISASALASASAFIFSISSLLKPDEASIRMACSLPVALSLADTFKIPLASISNVTSI